MSEPQWMQGDDAALGLDEECSDCGNFIHACECGTDPDKLHDEMNEL
jgi:hypothetical protein